MGLLSRTLSQFFISSRSYAKRKPAFKGFSEKKLIKKSATYTTKILAQAESTHGKRKKWYGGGPGSYGVPSHGAQKRAAQLNVYLLENISNVFYQGEICPELNEYSLTINAVRITPDMNNLNIYWKASGILDTDHAVNELLEQSKGQLRSVLTHKRLLGRIPPINFIKDTTDARLQEVESLLKIADMGPGHIPTDIAQDFREKPDITRKTSLNQNFKNMSEKFDRITWDSKYVTLEGPGGSREIQGNTDAFNKGGSKEDWGSSSNQYHFSDVKNSETCTTDDEKWFDKIELRSDIYDVDRASLVKQISSMKKRAKDRNTKPLGQSKIVVHDEEHMEKETISKYLLKLKQDRKGQRNRTVGKKRVDVFCEEQDQDSIDFQDRDYAQINTEPDGDIFDDFDKNKH